MCRHLAYLGPPVPLAALLHEPTHGLEHQAWAPREQRYGTVNADGWGVGWYDLAVRPEPARYRTVRPIWNDASFRSVAGLVSSGCVVAAVRSATPPSPTDEVNTPPFTSGPWLFAHNGALPGWHEGLGAAMRARLTEGRAGGLQGSTDSEVLFALVLDRLDAGDRPDDAVAHVVTSVAAACPSARLNLLLADGQVVVASAWGDTLHLGRRHDGTVLASEPLDEAPGWCPVPDRSLVTADGGAPQIRPLEAP